MTHDSLQRFAFIAPLSCEASRLQALPDGFPLLLSRVSDAMLEFEIEKFNGNNFRVADMWTDKGATFILHPYLRRRITQPLVKLIAILLL